MDKYEEIKSDINIIKSIKSSYIIKWIFSFLPLKQGMDVIIYNKELQNIFNFDIETFKNISGKYKIAEKNGRKTI